MTSPHRNRAKNVATSLIQMFTKWAATSPFGTEPKTVVSSLIQLLGKRQHRHLGTEPKTYLNMSNAGKIWQRYEDIASMI